MQYGNHKLKKIWFLSLSLLILFWATPSYSVYFVKKEIPERELIASDHGKGKFLTHVRREIEVYFGKDKPHEGQGIIKKIKKNDLEREFIQGSYFGQNGAYSPIAAIYFHNVKKYEHLDCIIQILTKIYKKKLISIDSILQTYSHIPLLQEQAEKDISEFTKKFNFKLR